MFALLTSDGVDRVVFFLHIPDQPLCILPIRYWAVEGIELLPGLLIRPLQGGQ